MFLLQLRSYLGIEYEQEKDGDLTMEHHIPFQIFTLVKLIFTLEQLILRNLVMVIFELKLSIMMVNIIQVQVKDQSFIFLDSLEHKLIMEHKLVMEHKIKLEHKLFTFNQIFSYRDHLKVLLLYNYQQIFSYQDFMVLKLDYL